MILCGDLNINFASDAALPLIDFLDTTFYKKCVTQSTARSKSVIDAVFQRYINKIETKTFVSYFSYHKPFVSFVDTENLELQQ